MAGLEISKMKNPSWYLYGPGIAKVEELATPKIQGEREVLVRIAYVGVCGSDVHFWRNGGIGTKVDPDHPLVLGHEASGTIAAIGAAVTSVRVGDHVAIEPGFPCRYCKACKEGFYNLCPQIKFAAAPPKVHGTLTKFFAVPEDFVYKVPNDISLQEAALVEPLAVAVHTNRIIKVKPGQDVIIIGSGTVGLLCGAVAKAFGAYRVTLVDIVKQKLEFARGYVQCETVLLDAADTAKSNSEKILSTLGAPEGVDTVIEASGAESSVQAGIYALRLGGNYIQTGIGKAMVAVPLLVLSEKELTVRGCFRYGPGDYALALKLLSQRRISLKPLISSITPFHQASHAWDKTGRGEGIKNLIEGVRD